MLFRIVTTTATMITSFQLKATVQPPIAVMPMRGKAQQISHTRPAVIRKLAAKTRIKARIVPIITLDVLIFVIPLSDY